MKYFFAFTGIFFCLQVLAQSQNDKDSASYYLAKGQIARALPFAKRSFETINAISDQDTTYIAAASSLANMYYKLLKYDSSLAYYVKAAEGAKKRYGNTSVQYGALLVMVATVYWELWKYPEAGEAYQKATAILKKTENTNKKEYIKCLTAHANFYITTGNLNKAEELCLSAREIALREPVDRDGYASTLEKLARLYEKMGFYAKQEAVERQIYEIYKQKYGENYYKYVYAMGSLADVYQRNHDFERADSIYRKALGINEQLLGKNAAGNIYLLRRIGIVNTEMGKYEIAEKYLDAAMEIVNDNGGEESPLYTMCANNLARLYAASGRNALAASLFQRSLAIYSRQGLILHSARLSLLYDIADLLYADDPAKAAIYLQEAMLTENKLLLKKIDFLSETELLDYLKGTEDVADKPFRFLKSYKSPVIAGAAYNSRLIAGSIGLQNTRALYRSMAQSKDVGLAALWRNYQQQKSLYTSLLITPVAQRNANADSVAAILSHQEKDILRRSADYRNMKGKLAITWQDVQKHLQSNETAIEFVKFTGKQDTNANADMVYYAALLLRSGDPAPQFVMLCEEKQLIAALKKFPYKAALNNRGAKPAAYVQNTAKGLYPLLWQPLEPYLANSQTIYFSPQGLLHRVAFAAIPCQKGKLLCDRYHLVQLTSTRQVALQEARSPAPVSIALFGGINYNRQHTDTHVSPSPGLYTYAYCGDRGADLDSFRFLPNTLAEIMAIKKDAELVQKRTVVFTAAHATEAAFRNLDGDNSPEVIHFATHGFALTDTVQGSNAGAVFKESDNSLLRCGLVMAGGNEGWKGKARPGEDDGILTGLEISAVQLPHTRLAVLSACETGLGEIEGSEGVFGLQRAFKLAGVNYIMASLWQVPDKETAEFMETFYAHWLGGRTIRQAFFDTQQAMRKKYPPYYWAGFTLVQ